MARLLYLHANSVDAWRPDVVQVLEMCRAFSAAGAEVTLALPGERGSEGAQRDAIAAHLGEPPAFDVTVYRKRTILGRLNMVGGLPAVNRLLAGCTYDFCFTRNPTYVGPCMWRHAPLVFETHDAAVHVNRAWHSLWARQLVRASRKPAFRAFVAISRALGETWVARGVPREKLLVLHDACDPSAYRPPSERTAVREALGLPAGGKLVLYSGSLFPNRGVERVLELAAGFPDTCFAIVGGPPDRNRHYAGLARQQGLANVVLRGPVPHRQIPDYLAAADVLLMIWTRRVPTMAYCSPLKMFEYMAAGRLIVGEAFPTIREVLTDGQDALLVAPGDREALRARLAEALDRTYPDPLAECARELACRTYSWDARARAILGAWNAHAGEGRDA
jgi:glycosyltransferase involved in cell wall biosynthesis